MRIAVLTPDREIFEGNITSVKVPGSKGAFQVLNNHAPIVSALDAGKVELVTAEGTYSYYDLQAGEHKEGSKAGEVISFQVEGGFIEVLNNVVSLLIQGAK